MRANLGLGSFARYPSARAIMLEQVAGQTIEEFITAICEGREPHDLHRKVANDLERSSAALTARSWRV